MAFFDRDQLRGLGRLLSVNFEHYFFAIWGFGLALDPDYPMEYRFFGHLVTDAVLEYRAYALFAPWCIFLALTFPGFVTGILGALWTVYAWKRAGYYRSGFDFWTEAYRETPNKQRTRIRYAEALMIEIERRDKAGIPYMDRRIQDLVVKAMELQNLISGERKRAH